MRKFISGFPCFPASFSHPYFFGFFLILQIFVMSQHYINVDVKTKINFYFSELSTYLCRAFYGAKNAFPALIELSHMIQDPKFQVWRKGIGSMINSYECSSLLVYLFYFKTKLDIRSGKRYQIICKYTFLSAVVEICLSERECCNWVENTIYQSFF